MAPPRYLEQNSDGSYGYNACRIPWRLAVDAMCSGDKEPIALLRSLNQWLPKTCQGDPAAIVDGYNLRGRRWPRATTDNQAFLAPFALAAVFGEDQDWLDECYRQMMAGEIAEDDYFGNSIKALCLAAFCGRWRHWDKEIGKIPVEAEQRGAGSLFLQKFERGEGLQSRTWPAYPAWLMQVWRLFSSRRPRPLDWWAHEKGQLFWQFGVKVSAARAPFWKIRGKRRRQRGLVAQKTSAEPPTSKVLAKRVEAGAGGTSDTKAKVAAARSRVAAAKARKSDAETTQEDLPAQSPLAASVPAPPVEEELSTDAHFLELLGGQVKRLHVRSEESQRRLDSLEKHWTSMEEKLQSVELDGARQMQLEVQLSHQSQELLDQKATLEALKPAPFRSIRHFAARNAGPAGSRPSCADG